MKYVTLLSLKDEEKQIDFDYRKMLQLIVGAPIGGQGGVNVAEMRKAIAILDKLDKLGDSPTGAPVLALETAEWEFVNERVKVFPFPKAHRVYVRFCDDIDKAAGTSPAPEAQQPTEV